MVGAPKHDFFRYNSKGHGWEGQTEVAKSQSSLKATRVWIIRRGLNTDEEDNMGGFNFIYATVLPIILRTGHLTGGIL